MKKRILTILMLLAVLAAAVYFWWPLPFSPLLSECTEIRVIRIESGIQQQVSCNESFPAGTETFEAIQTVLERYSYHRTFRSLEDDSSMEGNHAGYWLSLYLYEGETLLGRIACGGTGEIAVKGRVYRMGYWGDGTALAFMEDLSALLP